MTYHYLIYRANPGRYSYNKNRLMMFYGRTGGSFLKIKQCIFLLIFLNRKENLFNDIQKVSEIDDKLMKSSCYQHSSATVAESCVTSLLSADPSVTAQVTALETYLQSLLRYLPK